GLRAPWAVGVGNGAQEVAIQAVVAAVQSDVFLDRFFRQLHHRAEARFDALGRAERGEPLPGFRTAHQIIDRRALAEAKTETLDVADQLLIAAPFLVRQQIGEHGPYKLLLVPALMRLEPWRNTH